LKEYADETSAKITFAKDKYKAKLTILTENEEIDLIVKVLKVDEEKCCMEFNKVNGDQMAFFKIYNEMKGYFGELNDTTY